jgi:hypothetical protein
VNIVPFRFGSLCACQERILLFLHPERSAVVCHHRVGPFGLAGVVIARRNCELLDLVHGFIP